MSQVLDENISRSLHVEIRWGSPSRTVNAFKSSVVNSNRGQIVNRVGSLV